MSSYSELFPWFFSGHAVPIEEDKMVKVILDTDAGEELVDPADVSEDIIASDILDEILDYHPSKGATSQLIFKYDRVQKDYHLALECMDGWVGSANDLVKGLQFLPLNNKQIEAISSNQQAQRLSIEKLTFTESSSHGKDLLVGTVTWKINDNNKSLEVKTTWWWRKGS